MVKLANWSDLAAKTKQLPNFNSTYPRLLPKVDHAAIPTVNPIKVAIKLITGGKRSSELSQRGGLWVSGDQDEALARLRWIVGVDNMRLLRLENDGRARLDLSLLKELSGATDVSPEAAALTIADYINSNEGLLLLVQITFGQGRYRLHIGKAVPTRGSPTQVLGSINLDNNYDSRINPYRRLGKKLDNERPPEGFDSLIGINPSARWFNLRAGSLVPVGHITFHELAEAYAKVELGLDYLAIASRPGAHNIAIERERKLQSERPFSDVVVTIGANRVLRSEEEVRQFWAEGGGSGANQR
jgi:hypothetical protein